MWANNPIAPKPKPTGPTKARAPVAPRDWAVAKRLPATTLPIPAWAAAAALPAATPVVVNPATLSPAAVAPTADEATDPMAVIFASIPDIFSLLINYTL